MLVPIVSCETKGFKYFIFLVDISQESNQKSQYEILVLSSYAKNVESPRALFEENFCGCRRSNGHAERVVQLIMLVSHRHLGLAFVFGFGAI